MWRLLSGRRGAGGRRIASTALFVGVHRRQKPIAEIVGAGSVCGPVEMLASTAPPGSVRHDVVEARLELVQVEYQVELKLI